MWASAGSSDFSGDPKAKGFQYLGMYNGERRGMGISGSSIQFEDALTCRYLMFINDGSWHGTDFLKQLDVFIK